MKVLVNRRRIGIGVSVSSVLLAACVGGYLWWRRRQQAGSPELGAFLPAWITGGPQGESSWDMGRASKAQIERAEARLALADWGAAEDRRIFTTGARASAGPAYFHTAYWLAVGSRLLGYDADLVRLAKANQAYGAQWAIIPGASLRTGNVPDIYRAASTLLAAKARASGNRQLAGVVQQVAFSARDVEHAQATHADTEPLHMAAGFTRGAASDALSAGVSAVEISTGVFTGRQPSGMGATTWFLLKWGLRAGIGLAVLAGAAWYFGPTLAPVLAPVARAAGSAARRGASYAGETWDDYAERRAMRQRFERDQERRRLALQDAHPAVYEDESGQDAERAELRRQLRTYAP